MKHKIFGCLLIFALLFGCASMEKKDEPMSISELEKLAEGAEGKWSDYDDMGAGTIVDADTFLVRDASDAKTATGYQFEYPWSVMKSDLASANFSNVLDDNQALEIMADADGMDPNEYNGVIVTGRNCGEDLVQWDTVHMANDGDPWHKADANVATEFPAIGLSIAACTDGGEAKILTQGVVRNESWAGLTPGGAVYLSITAGGLSQTAPIATTECIQIIGWALSDSEILFDFHRPYAEIE